MNVYLNNIYITTLQFKSLGLVNIAHKLALIKSNLPDSPFVWIVPLALVVCSSLWGLTTKRIKGKPVPDIKEEKESSPSPSSPPSSPSKSYNLFADLPPEMVVNILSILDGKELASVSQVCKKNYTFISECNSLWRDMFMKRWGDESDAIPSSGESWKALYTHTAKEEQKRLSFEPYVYLLSVMEQCAEWTDAKIWKQQRTANPKWWWVERFIEEMANLEEVYLIINEGEESREYTPTGKIICKGSQEVIGEFRFLSVADTKRKFSGVYLELPNLCPYTGNTLGYINFTLYPIVQRIANPERIIRKGVAEFLRTVTYQTRGILARTDTNYYTHIVRLADFPLENVTDRLGLSDGNALLETEKDSPYIQNIISGAQKVLELADFEGYGLKVAYVTSTHNPIRLMGDLNGKSLAGLRMKIWVYYCSILKDENMWMNFRFSSSR
eukprot:TRINITY_DN8331_c0_g1_i8.p1 TRINITY_DN8331_c0_g1~~TRINITY_DN8331_c0_g1_i8.p1  ORF type:complete len:441 (-),score=93.09 TRINITY_DN8331_c0_g1_i8:182-1504(-)